MSEHAQHTPESQARRASAKGVEAIATKSSRLSGNAEYLAASVEAAGEVFGFDQEALEVPANALVVALASERPEFTDELMRDLATVIDTDSAERDLVLEREQKRVIEKYTDPQMTEALIDAIDAGLFDSVRERMGIKDGQELPYEVRVVSATFEQGELATFKSNFDHDYETADDVSKWKKGMILRGEQFQGEYGTKLPPAFVQTIEGVNVLVVTSPTVEKILYPEVNADYYNDSPDAIARDVAYLEHEFAHTQQLAQPNRGSVIGMAIEERRAEALSGNRQGYYDVKYFFKYMDLISGGSVRADLSTGYESSEDLYASLVDAYGESGALDALLVQPNSYRESGALSEEAMRLHDAIGGYDGAHQRMIEAAIQEGRGAEVEAVFEEQARFYETNPSLLDVLEREMGGESCVVDLIRSKMALAA